MTSFESFLDIKKEQPCGSKKFAKVRYLHIDSTKVRSSLKSEQGSNGDCVAAAEQETKT